MICTEMFYRWTLILNTCIAITVGLGYDVHAQNKGNQLVEFKINNFKHRLHEVLNESMTAWKSRAQRRLKLLPVITTSTVEIKAQDVVAHACTANVSGSQIVFLLNASNTLSILRDFENVPVRQFPTNRHFVSLQAFEHFGRVWLITHYNKVNKQYINLYEVDFNSSSIVFDQKLRLRGPSIISTTKDGNTVDMAVVTTHLFSELKLFRWTGKQFDQIFTKRIQHCSAVTIWKTEEAIYVALSFTRARNLRIERFIEHSKEMRAIQLIDVEAETVKNFNYLGNYYLLCWTRDSVIIYHWTGSAFSMEYTKTFDNPIVDVVTNSLSKSLLIAIAFNERVTFLIKDSSSQYVLAGNVDVNPLKSLRNIILWRNGTVLYMLPVFKDIHPISLYKISLKLHAVGLDKPQFTECLDMLLNKMRERQKQIDNLSSTVKNIESASRKLSVVSLKVNGTTKSSTTAKVDSLLPKNVSYLFSLQKMAREMLYIAELLRKELMKSVFKSEVQFIENRFAFKNLSVKKGIITGLEEHVNLNRLCTNRLPYALKKRGNQIFEFRTKVSDVFCGTASTMVFNGNKLEDYILLKPNSSIVTGQLRFSNVSVETLVIHSNMINGVDMDNFVLSSKKQDVNGIKIFRSLSAEAILTKKRVGEVHVDSIKNVVDSVNLKKSSLNFASTLRIRGNLNVKTLNEFDMINIYSKCVKKAENQVIPGKKIFKSLTIKGNIKISGRTNGLNLNQLMTVSGDETIYGNMTFGDITYFQSIFTDSLNGVDLSEQAVVNSLDGEVTGVKTFQEVLTVSDIAMKEGIVIDSTDPSALMSEIIYKSNKINVMDTSEFKKTVVVGNIIAQNMEVDANSLPLLSNMNNVWLKTTEQDIPSLRATKMRVNALQVSTVNGLAIKDIVTVHENSVITGIIEFLNDTTIKTLNLTEGSILNLSPKSNPIGEVRIMNKLTLDDAEFEGIVSVDGVIKDMESGFVHVGKHQTVKNEFEFEKIKTKGLSSKNLKFQLLNKKNFTEYIEQSVVPLKNRSISMKYFKELKGTEMKCNGTLNNVSIDRLVTTNTKQKITFPWKFMNNVSFDRIQVKSFFDGIRLEDVVYVDEFASISHKQFNKNLVATHVNTSRLLSGINITSLQMQAFNKSGINVIEKRFKFKSNLTAKEVQVIGSKLDNVDLNDLIMLNESVKFKTLNAASIIAMNTTVKGLINGCPWTSILENALAILEVPLNVTSVTTVKSLTVDGNLKLEYLNGGSLPDGISILKLLASSGLNDSLIFENLVADRIQIRQQINDISVESLLNDVVKKSIPQVITSGKKFRDISASNLTVDQLNSNNTCGVDMTHLFKVSLNRNTERGAILEVGSLGGVAAKIISIKGKLNYLKLPDDVVMLNRTEVIENDVIIMTYVNAMSGINVSGSINDIVLEKFLDMRVTLNRSEVIFSTLNFTEDVVLEGSTFINGTINDIYIDDIVNSKLQNRTVNSTKTFTEELKMAADVIVNGSVNGMSLDQILWSSRNESAKHIQFSRLSIPSLVCDSIEGLDITDFFDDAHDAVHYIDDSLHNFTANILSYRESLRVRKDFFESRLSIFSHFELQEILDFGIIQRFLPVYEHGTFGEKYELQVTQMVMWIEKRKSRNKTKSSIADVLQNGTFNVTKKRQGKIYAFSLREEKEGVVGFYVQTEYSKRCKNCILIKTMYSSGLVERETVESPENATIIDIQLLEIHDVFLLTAYNIDGDTERIIVYHHNSTNDTWSPHQIFHNQEIASLQAISVDRESLSFFDPPSFLLAVTGSKNNPGITIYEWDFEEDEFYLKTNMSTSVASHVLWFDYQNTLHLLVAKGATRMLKNTTWVNVYAHPLEVYTLEDELLLNHTVKTKGVSAMELFILQEEAFVLASSNHMGIIYVLQFRGYNGFEVIQEIPAPGITETRVFTVDRHLYLAVNSMTGPSRILKAAIRGGRLDLD